MHIHTSQPQNKSQRDCKKPITTVGATNTSYTHTLYQKNKKHNNPPLVPKPKTNRYLKK
ncbi:hypothetical protein MtrunA17_Chr4g0034001 [Medicago truncatula]|uniref:Uncharacterized protein n=1 Tax=Medicago truncatula TaxID=3880 RepID=A0A396IED6_MEDTR|nr:hypothetical protein MtrunA17_Chr4g0034001 [Medicago truncatula]